MSSVVTPLPVEHVDADGWTVRTYADGNWTRRKIVGNGMLCGQSWDWVRQDTPQAVIDGDLAMMREAGRQFELAREKVFLEAFFGEPTTEPPARVVQAKPASEVHGWTIKDPWPWDEVALQDQADTPRIVSR